MLGPILYNCYLEQQKLLKEPDPTLLPMLIVVIIIFTLSFFFGN